MPSSLGEVGVQRGSAKPHRPGSASSLVHHADEANTPFSATESGLAIERLAYTIEEAAAALGIGRDLIYDEIRTGRLRSKKAGARRIIGRHHLLEWLDSDHLERRHKRAS